MCCKTHTRTPKTTGSRPLGVLYFGLKRMGSHHPIRKTVPSEPVAIPDKLYFRIGDVARLCDVPAYVLRFWETEFSQLKPNKGGTGQRLYRKKDVEMALRIKSLLYDQGYTIPGARQVFKTGLPGEQPAPELVAASPSSEPARASSPHPAPEIWAAKPSPEAEPYDRGAELRLRAQLADLRDELQTVLDQLSRPLSSVPAGPPPAPHTPAPVDASAQKPRPHLVLEPKPAPRTAAQTAAQTTLHLTSQGDLFSAE